MDARTSSRQPIYDYGLTVHDYFHEDYEQGISPILAPYDLNTSTRTENYGNTRPGVRYTNYQSHKTEAQSYANERSARIVAIANAQYYYQKPKKAKKFRNKCDACRHGFRRGEQLWACSSPKCGRLYHVRCCATVERTGTSPRCSHCRTSCYSIVGPVSDGVLEDEDEDPLRRAILNRFLDIFEILESRTITREEREEEDKENA